MGERAVKLKYRRNAVIYDRLVARPTQALRREAVARRAIRPPETASSTWAAERG